MTAFSGDPILSTKWSRILAGETVACSASDLTEFESLDSPVVLRLASIVNPKHVGTLDYYLAFLKSSPV